MLLEVQGMGSPAVKIDKLMVEATQASERAISARENAREDAVKAIRELEARLVEALDGDTLRGISRLQEGDTGIQGINVRGAGKFGIDTYLPTDGREVLIISKGGRLQMASVNGGVEKEQARDAFDAELTAQDLEPIASAMQKALERHIVRAERTEKNYVRVTDLCEKLASVFGYSF